MDDAESAQSSNEGYYQLSPFGFLGDSYFTQPQYDYQQYGDHHIGSSGQLGLGLEYSGGVNCTNPISPFPLPTSYQPYQSRDPMEPDLLSAEKYQEGTHTDANLGQREGRSTQLYGGFLASSPHKADTPSPRTTNMKARRTSVRDASKSVAAEDNSTHHRGRPRLDTRDQTAAEVRLLAS